MNFRRLISFLLIFCLIFTQTAQAYSLARLPYKYQHTTNKARLDGTNQSENRSSLVSRNGNINVLAINNITITGSDISAGSNSLTDPTREQQAANDVAQTETPAPGQINLTAGNAVVIYAGQDTLKQSSSTETVTSPNAFTKIRHNVADTSFNLDAFGSTLSGTGVSINSGGATLLEGTQITAGTGGINIDAAGDLLVYAAVDQHSSTHTETLDTDGFTFRADGSLNDTDTRRMNNTGEGQTLTHQVASLVSDGNITTHSGGDTLFEATTFDAQGAIHFSATGYEATTNEDGTINEGRKGTITFAGIKDSTYTNVANSESSMPWQSADGHGEMVETLQLANIKAGEGITYDAAGGIIVDIPELAAEAPAPVEAEEPLPTHGADGKPLTDEEKAALIAEREAQAAEKAAEAAEAKRIRAEQRFTDHINQLASQPGQEWIGQLAQMAKEQPDAVKLQQVNQAVQHWDYDHAGLTPEAAAVIVIVVTYFTAGVASGAGTGASAAVGGGTTGAVVGAATTAAVSTLASQAAVSLINNQGDLGQTLNDLGSSENVHALVTAMITAGVLQGLSQNIDIGGVNMSEVNAQSDFFDQLQKNVINSAASAVVNHAMYGGDLQQQLEQALKTALIDTGAAQSANWIGDMKVDGDLNAFTHKLAHAIAGCAAGAARAGDCSSGALGAVVGELSAEWYGGDRTNDNINQPGFQTDTVNFAKLMAGVAAAITGGDAEAINLAAGAGGNAAENNFLGHVAQNERDQLREKAKGEGLTREESATLAKLELADQLSDELLNKYRSGETLTANDEYNLGFYLWAYKQQEGAQATANLVANGSAPTYDFPYASSTPNQLAAMDALREQNGGGILADIFTSRPASENQEIFFEAMRDSGMGGSMFGGVNPNETFLPSANRYDFSTLDALINSPVMGTGAYLIGTGIGADPASVNAFTQLMSNLSDILSAPVLPRVGLGPAYGSTSASASAMSIEGYFGLMNPSGSVTSSANAARNQYHGNGGSASPSPGTNAAGSSGAGVNVSWMSRPDYYVSLDGTVVPATGYRALGGDQNVAEASNGIIAPRDPTYFTFDNITNMSGTEIQSLLQLEYPPTHIISFNTGQILNDISIPNGRWGTWSMPEPITTTFPEWGSGGGTQAVTNSPIAVDSLHPVSRP